MGKYMYPPPPKQRSEIPHIWPDSDQCITAFNRRPPQVLDNNFCEA